MTLSSFLIGAIVPLFTLACVGAFFQGCPELLEALQKLAEKSKAKSKARKEAKELAKKNAQDKE